MTLAQFLLYWHTFVLTHVCQVWRPDTVGLGNHVVYEGNCGDGFTVAHAWDTIITWAGASQGVATL